MENPMSGNQPAWLWKMLLLISCIATFAAGLACYLWLFESFSNPLRQALTLMVMALVAVYEILTFRKFRAALDRAAREKESHPH